MGEADGHGGLPLRGGFRMGGRQGARRGREQRERSAGWGAGRGLADGAIFAQGREGGAYSRAPCGLQGIAALGLGYAPTNGWVSGSWISG